MTRVEVTHLAQANGYDTSDPQWLARSAGAKSKQLTMVELTFRNGGLVAVRQGAYDPRTKKVVYRTIDLCGTPASSPAGRAASRRP